MVPFFPPMFIFISLILRRKYTYFLKTLSSWQNSFIYRDKKKKAICWKYEERFLTTVNKLWEIALTDRVEALSLEEKEQIMKVPDLRIDCQSPDLLHRVTSLNPATQSQPRELAVPTISGKGSGLLWKVLLPPTSLKLVLIPLGLLYQFDSSGALLSFPYFNWWFWGIYYIASMDSALARLCFVGMSDKYTDSALVHQL